MKRFLTGLTLTGVLACGGTAHADGQGSVILSPNGSMVVVVPSTENPPQNPQHDPLPQTQCPSQDQPPIAQEAPIAQQAPVPPAKPGSGH